MFGQFLYLAKFLPSLTAFFAIMYIFIVVNGQILNKIITHLATLVKCVTRQVYQTILGSGCGSVGRAVISDTRGLRFESRHWQIFIYIEHLLTVNCVLKRRK